MSASRRIFTVCLVAATVGPLLNPHRAASAERPVHEVQIVASRFAFEPATVRVAAGEAVHLVVRSNDGTHGFAIPTLKIDLHIPKTGEPATVDFIAPPAGDYEIACSELCGRGHGQMKAALVSVAPIKTNR